MTNAYPGATKQTSWPTPPLHLTTPDHAAGLTSVRPVEKGTSCSKVRLCSPDAEAAATIKSISKHPIHDRATVAAFQQLASQQDGSAKAMLRTPDFSFPAKNAKCQKSIYTTDMIQVIMSPQFAATRSHNAGAEFGRRDCRQRSAGGARDW
ncbi:uncharacterized protein YALI1_D09910g [Yarrowia lipolytica]|uniref:Uncharacterized protein n=1 Tax=Yarrowia lipolytica TaxID=4952 RepID=A0A1D8NDN2_YARLL|nr:hypothetical protein YALI1_D09910g [Yarrowia lipolytica]